MLNVSSAFKDHIFNTKSIQWEYSATISGVGTFTGKEIKSINITGELQKEFTIGSSLAKSLELELLVSEKTYIPESSSINITLYLVISDQQKESVNLGTFYPTEVDRQTIGRLKINAIDAMGHIDILDSQVDMVFPDTATTVSQIVTLIAQGLSLGFDPSKNSEFYNHTIGTFKIVVPEFSYRQMLEYLAGFCGCNVRITNEQYIEFFRFKDTGIELTKGNYYNMSKGQYLFKPTALACSIGDATSIIGSGKDSATIKFSNPYMTEEQLRVLYPIFCSGDIEYYPINANIIGTSIFEPGDIVTIVDHYNEKQKIYIQDYKLTCNNGVKETLDSHFDYNKGSISNSISNKINQLNTSLKQYVSENFVSHNDFDITIRDISENIQYSHDGLNKWLIEYYKLEADYDKSGNILDRDYDLIAIKGKDYERCELIDDGPILSSSRLYDDSHTLCRYFTGVYIKDGDNLFKNVVANVSNGVNVYINGINIIRRADSEREYPITLQSGWNTIELITGAKPQELTAITISFKLKYEYADEGAVDPFYHLTATMTQEEKDLEEQKKNENENSGNEENTPTEPDTGGNESIEGGENTGGTENVNPIADEEVTEEDNEKVSYKRFDYIRLVNAYLIDINYKRVTEVERLTTTDSIIDRVSKSEYTDGSGETVSGVDLLLRESSVVQEVDKINQTIIEYEKGMESTEEKISEVTQTVDNFKLSFTTALYGNYFSNSSFGTDDPLTGFNYCLPSAKGKEDHVFTLRTDTETAVGRELETVIVDSHDVSKYGHLKYYISSYNDGSFQGVVPNDDENAYASSSRTLSMGKAFKISQTFFKEDENFPYYKNNETGDYYQFYFSIKAKRSESCLYKIGDRLHIYPRLSVSLVIDHDPIIVGEEGHEEEITRTTINNLVGLPSENEGIVEYGELLDLDVLPHLRDYEIDTEWKMIEYFIDLPKEYMDQIKVKSFSVLMETQYWTTVDKNYVIYQRNEFNLIRDIEEVKINEEVVPTIYICEPMFATTKDYLSVNYTNKQSEIITGVTNITQDGIQISRSDSELSTEIKNSGMAILYDGEMVAQFKEKTIIPYLDVTKKLMAPNVFHNTTNIPDTIYIGEEFANDEDCGRGPTDELMSKYVYFNDLNRSLDRYGIIQLDRLKIVIKANRDEEGNIKKVFPDNSTGSDTPNAFILDNLKCGIIEIYLEEGVILTHPLVIKNIDGTVKVRGPIEKDWITLNTEYIIGNDTTAPAPVVPNIIAHNIRWIEIWGLNFTGGKDFPRFNFRSGEYTDKMFPGETFKSFGELYTKKFDKMIFPFTSLYSYSTLEELNDIMNKVAIFIGYCWCGDISRCNFPSISKYTSYSPLLTSNYSIGIYGDHCDCYLFNNQGIVGKYYVNRNKCWFRLPIDSQQPQEDGNMDVETNVPNEEIGNWGNDTEDINPGISEIPIIVGGDGQTVIDLMDGIWPGGMIRKGKTDGRAIDHCYLGTSRDLAYLGSFLYDSAPKNTYDPSISTLGSNLTGYSRVKQNINLKGLKTLYNNTDGYFFGSGSSLPSISYSPEDTSVAAYNSEPEFKHTSLMNGLGLSITMPDIASVLGESRELVGAKLKLEFETINGKLVEYGNQGAFSSNKEYTTFGGGVVATENKGLAFGLRFVYDESHYNSDGEMQLGYYNMGTCLRGHEILASGKAINSWAISGNGSINSTQNFSHSGGMYGLSFPYVVGLNPFTNDGTLVTQMELPLDHVNIDWFDPNYISQYTSQYMGLESGYVDADSFFNTLKGLATSSIKYIDIVPVGVWDCMNKSDDYPSMDYYSHFNYDITEDQNAYIGLTTSCFKLKTAELILDIVSHEEAPEARTINITYQTQDGTILSKYSEMYDVGAEYNIADKIEKEFDGYNYNNYQPSDAELEGNLYEDLDIIVYYDSVEDTPDGELTINITYQTLEGVIIDRISNNYSIGAEYDITNEIEKEFDGYTYNRYQPSDAKLQGNLYENLDIIVYYDSVGTKDYSITIHYECGDTILRTDKLEKKFAYGESYDLTSIVKPNLFIEYNSDGDTYYFVFRSWQNTYGGMSNMCLDGNGLTGVVKEDMVFYLDYKQVFKKSPEIYSPLYTDDLPNEYRSYYSGSMTMGINSFVGKLDRTSPNNSTRYYRSIYGVAASAAANNSDLMEIVKDNNGPIHQKGLPALGFEYIVPSDLVKNVNENQLYLNITFDTKSYASPKVNYDNHPVYGETYEDGTGCDLNFYVRLIFGHSRTVNGIGEFGENCNSLRFSDYNMTLAPDEIVEFSWVNNMDESYWGPWHYLTGMYRGSDDNSNYFTISDCSASGNGTRTIKINLSNLDYDSSWYDDLKEKYDSYGPHHSIGFIDPDTFFNVPLMVKNYLSAVQIIPDQDCTHLSPTTGELDCQCLMVTDISFSNN